jgi:hypothetical protein
MEGEMANWKHLTSPRGQPVIVNLDAVVEIKRFPEQNITELWVGGDWKIEVRQPINEIFAASAVTGPKKSKTEPARHHHAGPKRRAHARVRFKKT